MLVITRGYVKFMGEPCESKTSKQGTIRGMVIHLSVQFVID